MSSSSATALAAPSNNDIWLGDLADRQYAVELNARNSSAVKHNRLWGGRWVVSSAVSSANTDIERGLARYLSGDASAAADVRGNVWLEICRMSIRMLTPSLC